MLGAWCLYLSMGIGWLDDGPGSVSADDPARFVLGRSYKRNDENANQDAHDRQEDDDRDFEHGCLRG